MILPQLNAILERFGIRKTPTKKELVIDRIIEELFQNHDPWLIRSQKYWRSSEPLFWPIGRAPRVDDVLPPNLALGHSAPSQADHSVHFEVDSVLPSDSVSQIGSRRGPQGRSASSSDQNVVPSVELPEIERRISQSQGSSLSNSTSSDHSRHAAPEVAPETDSRPSPKAKAGPFNRRIKESASARRALCALNLECPRDRHPTLMQCWFCGMSPPNHSGGKCPMNPQSFFVPRWFRMLAGSGNLI